MKDERVDVIIELLRHIHFTYDDLPMIKKHLMPKLTRDLFESLPGRIKIMEEM